MEVSTFELIFKNQAPITPNGVAALERVLQGYFLTISNLESRQYQFAVSFTIFPPPAGTPNQALRTLSGNTVCFVDSGGGDNSAGTLIASSSGSVFTPSSGLISIPPQGTALLAVLPSVFPSSPLDSSPIADPNFEVRGFVRITVPPILETITLPSGLRIRILKKQGIGPVRVLLTPQHRITFLSIPTPPQLAQINSQSQASLPTASGGALTSLTPESPFLTSGAEISVDAGALALSTNGARPAVDDERLGAFLGMLVQAGEDPTSLQRINALLADSAIPVTLSAVPDAN
jgi:hypothetical protein